MPESSADDHELAQAGYRPQFRRALGGFTAFAAGFSYLSILTGIVQNFYLGFREAGPAFVWTWPAVFAGQLALALCFADLAREYPFCGGVYAWSRRGGSLALGWFTGWVYLASLVVTLAAVALAWQIVLPPLWEGFQFMATPGQNAAVLGAILVVISTVLNAVGTRTLAVVMNVGVVVELIAAVLLIVSLGINAVHGPSALFEVQPAATDDGFGMAGPFLAAAVMAAYVLYGFDTAGTLAEETQAPRKQTPRAIIQALAAAGGLGMLLLLTAIAAAPNLTDELLGQGAGGLPYLMKQVLGETLGKLFIASSVAAIFVCTLAVHANAARVLFAMARDRTVPGWQWLGTVESHTQSPRAASVLIGVLAGGLLVLNINYENVMTALVCVSIVWANLAYLFVNSQLVVRRIHGKAGWRSATVATVAVIWTKLLIVNIAWPRERLYGAEWYQRYGAPLFTAVLLLVGAVVYFGLIRPAPRPEETA